MSRRASALTFAVCVAFSGCNGLIGDTYDRSTGGQADDDDDDDSKSPTARPPANSLEALATRCASDAAPGSAWDGVRRLTRDELIATFTDLVGSDVMTPLASFVALLPDDALIKTPDLASETYTEAHTEAIIRLIAQIGERVAATEKGRVRVFGTCGRNATAITDTCVKNAVTAFGKRAFRRPLATEEVDELMRGYTSAIAEDRLPLLTMRILASPSVLFHNERGTDDVPTRSRLTPYEVASRISYQTTGSMPDSELFAAADAGGLDTVDAVRTQVFRLLQTPRGHARVRDFARYWLLLDDVPQPSQQSADRGGFKAGDFRTAALNETYDFVENVSFENGGTLDELMRSPLTYAKDAVIAELYGTPAWDGQSAAPESPTHRGLLNRVAYLIAQADSTSPIMRAVHFRERVMCAFVAPPDFSVIGTRNEQLGEISRLDHSTRAAVTELTSTSQCSGCHTTINPPGFVFEAFGPLGEHRTEEVVYDANEINKVVARHAIDTRVDDLQLGGDPVSASSMDDLLTFITGSTAADACVAQHVSGYFASRSMAAGDWCGAQSVAQVLAEGGSFVDALASAVAKEDIFWRGAP